MTVLYFNRFKLFLCKSLTYRYSQKFETILGEFYEWTRKKIAGIAQNARDIYSQFILTDRRLRNRK